jgi:hypothetical protein
MISRIFEYGDVFGSFPIRKCCKALIRLFSFVSAVSLLSVKEALMRFFFLSCLMLCLFGCGKVTQVVSSDPESPVFDLTYAVAMVPTSQVQAKLLSSRTATSNVFSLYDVPLYAVVSGISPEGVVSELSWGSAEWQIKDAVTGNANLYRSVNFRKDGVESDRPDYKWASLELSPRLDSWAIKAVKVKHGYSMYILAAYSPRGVLALRVIPQSLVSGNSQVSLPALSAYDTFVSVLYMMALAEQPSQPSRVQPLDIQRVFTPEFFKTIQYEVPPDASSVMVTAPMWTFDRVFEKRLLTYFYLVRGNESKEAEALLPVLAKSFPSILTPSSIRLLKAGLSSPSVEMR